MEWNDGIVERPRPRGIAYGGNTVITPRVRMCSRGKAIGLSVVCGHKNRHI